MNTVYETRDVLLALSFYLEQGELTKEREKEINEVFRKIANDEVVLVKKGE